VPEGGQEAGGLVISMQTLFSPALAPPGVPPKPACRLSQIKMPGGLW
jgi:hypothetical protein